MILLLSPSKTQDFTTPPPVATHTQPELLDESLLLMDKLRGLTSKKIATLMGVSNKIATLNHERFQQFHTPFTPRNAKQAAFAFKGDVYDGLDAETLDKKALAFAQKHLRILSGFYGVLKPLDLIQPYRLEMSIKLANSRGKDLYRFWGDRLSEVLNSAIESTKATCVVNLASEEYFKAVNVKTLHAPIITPQFKEKKNDNYQMIGLFAKRARGAMARFAAQHAITSPDGLLAFAEDDYKLNKSLSKPDSPVFTRER